MKVDGTVVRLAAADDRLFAVTLEGGIYCFGADKGEPKVRPLPIALVGPSPTWEPRARAVLEASKVREGYCIAWGAGNGDFLIELARLSKLHIVAVDPDETRVAALRKRLTAAGLYGERVAVHAGDPATFPFPPYLASLMVSEDLAAAGVKIAPEFLARAFQSLRPYGGTACFWMNAEQQKQLVAMSGAAALACAAVHQSGELTLLVREGPLPGSANWTHEHADAANTRVSKDRIVKAPLGVLWFGGPSHDGILPRHGHGPMPQVVDGRLIIEGMDMLRAVDIYTGRLLWEAALPGVGKFYNNLSHQPGANASGTNYISMPDGIYVANDMVCQRLDPETGKPLAEFHLPHLRGVKGPARWGYVNVADNYLVGGAEPLLDPKLLPPPPKAGVGDDPEPAKTPPKTTNDKEPKKKKTAPPKDTEDPLTKLLKKMKSTNDNLSSSRHLVVMDRHTGKVLWTATADYGFRHNATCVGGGRLYAIDRMSGPQLDRLKRRGEKFEHTPRLIAYDLHTGKELWSADAEVFGTWLSYSTAQDVLVESGRVARDTISDEPKGMRAYRATNGKVLWFQPKYLGPAMIHGDTILKNTTACDLVTGVPKLREDPITGELAEWQWARTHGCNTPAASEHLLTFRSGAAGYLDLAGDGGTGNFGGFRSSCTNNLIVAGGVLTAPDYTRTCTCSYQNQTSLAMIHMPEAEMWTFFGPGGGAGPVKRLGLNLGAPGDRRADDGTLWIEYPSVGGKSPAVPVQLKASKPEWFRRHSSQVTGPLNWAACAGVKGLESLKITLDPHSKNLRLYTVRLHFVEPDGLKAGQRLFHVSLQGREVLHDLDVAREAGGPMRALVKEFRSVQVRRDLEIRFSPSSAECRVPLLCSVEVVAEEAARPAVGGQ